MRWWPWKPRELVALNAALAYVEHALEDRERAARRQREVMADVREELDRESERD